MFRKIEKAGNPAQAQTAKELVDILSKHHLQNPPVRNTTLGIYASNSLLYAILLGLNIYKLFNPDFAYAWKYGHSSKLPFDHNDCISEQRPIYIHKVNKDPVEYSCEDCCVLTPPGAVSFVFLTSVLLLSLYYILKEFDKKDVNYDVIIETNEGKLGNLLDAILQYKYPDKDMKALSDFAFRFKVGNTISRKQLSVVLNILEPIADSVLASSLSTLRINSD